jgi:hypothetical protein
VRGGVMGYMHVISHSFIGGRLVAVGERRSDGLYARNISFIGGRLVDPSKIVAVGERSDRWAGTVFLIKRGFLIQKIASEIVFLIIKIIFFNKKSVGER